MAKFLQYVIKAIMVPHQWPHPGPSNPKKFWGGCEFWELGPIAKYLVNRI